MKNVRFDAASAKDFFTMEDLTSLKSEVLAAKEVLLSGTGEGNDYIGWRRLPVDYDKEEFARIKTAAEKIRKQSDVLIVIGIGGSYLGARAAIEFLQHSFYNVVGSKIRKAPEIYFCGSNMSSTYLAHQIGRASCRERV